MPGFACSLLRLPLVLCIESNIINATMTWWWSNTNSSRCVVFVWICIGMSSLCALHFLYHFVDGYYSLKNSVVTFDTGKATSPRIVLQQSKWFYNLHSFQTSSSLSSSVQQKCCAIFKLAKRLSHLTSMKKGGGKKDFCALLDWVNCVMLSSPIMWFDWLIDLPNSYVQQSSQKENRGIDW